MKRFFGLLVFLLALNSCDDGDLQVDSFDFTEVDSATCGEDSDFFVYKINGNEVLIIEVDENTYFPDKVTPEGTPRRPIIPTNAKVTYRLYDGPVSNATLCSSIPPATPKVLEEWTAVGGTMEIVTNIVHPTNETTGANFITGYNHTITFKDIVFYKGNGETQRNEVKEFGSYTHTIPTPANFQTLTTKGCLDSNLIFKLTGAQALTIDLDEATYNSLFINASTPVNQPRVAYVNDNNKVSYRVFATNPNDENFCGTGALPTAIETWNSVLGVENMSGIIEVSTTTNGGNFIHTVVLKKVTLLNTVTNLSFTFGNAYEFGTVETN